MKRKNILLLFIMMLGLRGFSQSLSCSIVKQGGIEFRAADIGNAGVDTICVNQPITFCTEAVAGATYTWSAIGSGFQIISVNGNCVTVTATTPGTYRLCLSKGLNGYEPCCVCKTIVAVDCGGGGGSGPCPPCPLKIVIDGTHSRDGFWDYNCPYNCITNRMKLNVECVDNTSLNNWIATNGITGTIKWEVITGYFNFISWGGYVPCAPFDNTCGGYKCQSGNIAATNYLRSGYLCACNNLPFWENFTVRATIKFVKNGDTCERVVNEVIHLSNEDRGCGGSTFKGNSGISDVKIFPNPAAKEANIRFTLPADARFESALYDFKGNKVLNIVKTTNLGKGNHQYSFKTNGLKEKMYSIVFTLNGETVKKEALLIE